jgi:hypothetical protein
MTPWFETEVDLNKVGPDPSQVNEARKSVEEIERRSSAKQAEKIVLQKREPTTPLQQQQQHHHHHQKQ